MVKQQLAKKINSNCVKSSCFICKEADKYDSYEKCPYLALKQIALQRKLTVNDIPDDLEQ